MKKFIVILGSEDPNQKYQVWNPSKVMYLELDVLDEFVMQNWMVKKLSKAYNLVRALFFDYRYYNSLDYCYVKSVGGSVCIRYDIAKQLHDRYPNRTDYEHLPTLHDLWI